MTGKLPEQEALVLQQTSMASRRPSLTLWPLGKETYFFMGL